MAQDGLRIAVTGASGLVGSRLTRLLEAGGHRVLPMVRRAPKPGSAEVRWNPRDGEVDTAALEGVDAVVHLAGKNVAEDPWTPETKAAIRNSRVRGTEVLCRALAGMRQPPGVLVSASAVGYYGDRGDEVLTEESSPGQGFLAELSRDWEAATGPAEVAGIRVARLRIGMVLAPEGGALARMLPIFQAGVGGPLGGGRPWWSWIHAEDLVRAIDFLMRTEELSGPFNGTAPEPVTNAEFTRVLARVLGRPAVLPAPAFAVKLMLGREMAEATVLASSRVLPCRLRESGFEFRFPTLEPALRHLLAR